MNSKTNIIQPFQLESSEFRGRIVQLDTMLDDILGAHNYPRPVAHLVAETLTLALLLSSMLKYDGIFTLQTQGDGPVKMLAADVTSAGAVRGCATFDAERVENVRQSLEGMKTKEEGQNHLAQYLGKGYIAFTVDPYLADTERYQGIVELRGSSLIDCVQYYFQQSEQISTGIKMAVGQREERWHSCGIMLQKMPEEGGNIEEKPSNIDEDDWRRSMILLDSATVDEFLDEKIAPNEMLFRLFHEEGVRVYDSKEIYKDCRCSQERVENVLLMMSDDDREYMKVDGVITMTCEFCSKDFTFDESQIQALLKSQK